MGPLCGLSLQGGSDCPDLKWKWKRTIKTNRIKEMNTIKQTPQNKNRSIIVYLKPPKNPKPKKTFSKQNHGFFSHEINCSLMQIIRK